MDGDIRPLEPADPRRVAGHTLLGRLGSGGMGTVFLGADPESGGRVAVKTIHPHLAGDPSYRRRFRDEAYLASRVASFCTARVLAYGEDDGRPYLVTDYVGGISLQQRLADDGPLPPADLHAIAVGVASALAAIHAAGLVHRDLKPANVMLTLSGCRVIDFGIASGQHDDVADASGKVLGTPGWMAPEVLVGGPATPAADIFAWGCLIAHAGTGQMPIGGDPATLRTGDADLSGLPESLIPAVRAALAPDPARRPTASELLLALVEQPQPQAALRPEPALTPAPAARYRPAAHVDAAHVDIATRAFTPPGMTGGGSQPSRFRLLAGVGAVAGTVLVGTIIVGLVQGKDERRPEPVPAVPPTPSVSSSSGRRASGARPPERAAGHKAHRRRAHRHRAGHATGHGRHRGRHRRA